MGDAYTRIWGSPSSFHDFSISAAEVAPSCVLVLVLAAPCGLDWARPQAESPLGDVHTIAPLSQVCLPAFDDSAVPGDSCVLCIWFVPGLVQ